MIKYSFSKVEGWDYFKAQHTTNSSFIFPVALHFIDVEQLKLPDCWLQKQNKTVQILMKRTVRSFIKTRTTIVVSNGRYTLYQIHFIKYLSSNTIYPIPFIKYHLSNISYQIPFIKYHLSYTIFQIPFIKYLLSNTIYQIPFFK